jgi:ferrochelatase
VTTTTEAISRLLPAGMQCEFVTAFFDDADYLAAQAQCIQTNLPAQWDHLLMSYHGLPERQLKKADPTGGHCLSAADCCNTPSPAHAVCYRHQVYETSRGLARALHITDNQYSVSFQSRLGGGWVQPYTDEVLQQLPQQGVKHLAVTCPAFVADNLETLEEIGIQGRETFLEAGGESFQLIPCMNDDDAWVEALARIIQRRSAGHQTEPASSDTSR